MGAIDYILYGLEVDRFDDSFSSSLQFAQNDAGIEIEVQNHSLTRIIAITF